jgi:hypothetical protein
VSRYDNTDDDVQFFDGKIDELRVWRTVRTKAQLLSAMFLSLNELGNRGECWRNTSISRSLVVKILNTFVLSR